MPPNGAQTWKAEPPHPIAPARNATAPARNATYNASSSRSAQKSTRLTTVGLQRIEGSV